MIYGDLSPKESEDLLERECYGHLGFIDAQGKPNVLPITYVYSENAIYSISEEGEKIEAMRNNPDISMQVETLQLPDAWESVQIWGRFEELEGKDLRKITKLITDYWARNEHKQSVISPLRDIAVTDAFPSVLWRIAIDKVIGKKGGNPQEVQL